MVNPLFWELLVLVITGSLFCLLSWEKGLFIGFLYLQFSGFLKRVILWFGGLSTWQYTAIVGFPYLLFFSTLVGMLVSTRRSHETLDRFSKFWILSVSAVILLSILRSEYGLRDSGFVAILQFFPLTLLLCGERIGERAFRRIVRMFVATAVIHILYEFHQFLFGPFVFDRLFVETKYSVSAAIVGNFFRGIPLYDSAEVLYVHFALVTVVSLMFGGNHRAYARLLFIVLATILIGNRGGVVELVLAPLIAVLIATKFPAKRGVVLGLFLLVIFALNVFGAVLTRLISNIPQVDLGNSSFAQRLGALGTLGDRIVGRQIAFSHLSLFGLGFGTSGLMMSPLANKGLDFSLVNHAIFAHDLVGELILDFGVVGALLFVSLFLRVLLTGLDFPQTAPYVGVVMACFAVSAFLGDSYILGRAGFLVFFLVGYVFKARNEKKTGEAGGHKMAYDSPVPVKT